LLGIALPAALGRYAPDITIGATLVIAAALQGHIVGAFLCWLDRKIR
jgi:hypothetical protein